MVENWMKCFSQWEPGNQMVFSCVVLIAAFTLVVLGGTWGLGLWRVFWEGLGVCFKGYPPPENDEPAEEEPVPQGARLRGVDPERVRQVGRDFFEEQKAAAEEARRQAEVRQKLQEETARTFAPPPPQPEPRPQAKPDPAAEAEAVEAIQKMLVKVCVAMGVDLAQAQTDVSPQAAREEVELRIAGRKVYARDDVCDNPLNPTGHCLKEGGCKNDAECRRETDRFITPDPHADGPTPGPSRTVIVTTPVPAGGPLRATVAFDHGLNPLLGRPAAQPVPAAAWDEADKLLKEDAL